MRCRDSHPSNPAAFPVARAYALPPAGRVAAPPALRACVIPDRKMQAGITACARVALRVGPSDQYVSRVYCHRQPPPAAGTYVDWYKSSARRARFAITRVTYAR
jgi:hypothetical protein